MVIPCLPAPNCAWPWFTKKYDYAKKLKENFPILKTEVDALVAIAADTKGKIERRRVTMEPTNQCIDWLKKTEDLKGKAGKVVRMYNASCGCIRDTSYGRLRGIVGWLYCRQSKLGRDVVMLTAELRTHKSGKPDEILVPKERPASVKQEIDDAYLDLPWLTSSAESVLEKVVSWKRVGVFGHPGMGTTTIMKQVNNMAWERNLFTVVMFLSVGEDDNVESIQKKIMRRLIPSEDIGQSSSSDDAADKISRTLAGEKCLLLLDDVGFKIDLERVGLTQEGINVHVVMSSKKKSIFQEDVVEEYVDVLWMPDDDAFTLLQKLLGNCAANQHIIAKRIAKECGGLPGLIKVIASEMKRRNEQGWAGILTRLQSSRKEYIQGLYPEAFNSFNDVYNKLDKSGKKCLFYGALFPANHEINEDYLTECLKAEGSISSVSMRTARDEGGYILSDLKSRCLLDPSDKEKYVRMSPVFRRWIQHITTPNESTPNESWVVRTSSDELEHEPLTVDDWRNARWISLINYRSIDLLDRPECRNMSALFLQCNENLKSFPSNFFAGMCQLQVLDFSKTGVESLTTSIFSLSNLKSLYLCHCDKLKTLSNEITQLTSLQVLDIRHSGIITSDIITEQQTGNRRSDIITEQQTGNRHPDIITEQQTRNRHSDSITNLTSVRCLRVSFANGVFQIPNGFIQTMSSLEELTVEVQDHQNELWNISVATPIAAEVASLQHLTALTFYFPTTELFTEFVRASQSRNNDFHSFRIGVGPVGVRCPVELLGERGACHLMYCGGSDDLEEISWALNKASAFELINHSTVRDLSGFGINNMESLTFCVIEGCKTMTSIMNCRLVNADGIFPRLKHLHLINLQALSCVWVGPILEGTLSNLTSLTINDCPLLGKVLPGHMARSLPNLQILTVQSCSVATTILAAVPRQLGEVNDPPNGRERKNSSLLSVFFSKSPGSRTTIEPAAERLDAVSDALPGLRKMKLAKLPKLDSICEGERGQGNLPVLTTLSVNECGALKSILSGDLGRQLSQLQDLSVEDCGNATTVIETGTQVLTNLKNLKLVRLPLLASICPDGASGSLENLTTLVITTCPFITVLSGQLATQLSNLQYLKVEDCSGTTTIIGAGTQVSQAGNEASSPLKLKNLELINLPMLDSICENGSLLWKSLQRIEIKQCPKLKSFKLNYDRNSFKSMVCEESWWNTLTDDGMKQHLEHCIRFL